jgi:hypothetical protein
MVEGTARRQVGRKGRECECEVGVVVGLFAGVFVFESELRWWA